MKYSQSRMEEPQIKTEPSNDISSDKPHLEESYHHQSNSKRPSTLELQMILNVVGLIVRHPIIQI